MNENNLNCLWGAIKFRVNRTSQWQNEVEVAGFYLGSYIKAGERFFPIDEFTGIDIVEENEKLYIPMVEECFNIKDNDIFFGLPIFLGNELKNLESFSDKLRFARKKMYEYLACASEYEFSCITDLKDDMKIISFLAQTESSSYAIDMSKPLDFEFLKSKDKDENLYLNRKSIVNKVKERIVAQDDQVETFVNAVYNNQKYGAFEGLKTNIMIIGPTGVGKTELCKTIAKTLDVPMIIKDITKYSTTGYVGGDILSLLSDLLYESDGDIEKAEKGIIVLDESDKIGKVNSSNSSIRTIDIQHELYGLIGNGVYTVKYEDEEVEIDTSQITFIFTGAFQNIIDLKKKDKKSIGFNSCENTTSNILITREDLHVLGGMEREFLRRVPIIIQMNSLKKDDLKKIITTSKISNLKVWEDALLNVDNIKLTYDESVVDLIATKAEKLGGGASAIKTVVTRTLSQVLSDAADGNIKNATISISDKTIDNPKEYVLIKKRKRGNKYELSNYDG